MRIQARGVIAAAVCVGLPLLSSCGGAPTDPSAGRGNDPPDIRELCGTRITSSLPPPGPLRNISRTELEFDPPGSALAKVISVVRDLDGCEEDEGETVDLEVGKGGEILSIGGETPATPRRFFIADGCLQLEIDPGEEAPDQDAQDSSGDSSDGADGEAEGDPGPCGDSGFPIFREILNADPETDPYICIEVSEGDSCQDCAQDAGSWTFTTRTVVTFQATRSLSDVQSVDLCEGTAELVDIRLGESVRMTVTTTSRFEPGGP